MALVRRHAWQQAAAAVCRWPARGRDARLSRHWERHDLSQCHRMIRTMHLFQLLIYFSNTDNQPAAAWLFALFPLQFNDTGISEHASRYVYAIRGCLDVGRSVGTITP